MSIDKTKRASFFFALKVMLVTRRGVHVAITPQVVKLLSFVRGIEVVAAGAQDNCFN